MLERGSLDTRMLETDLLNTESDAGLLEDDPVHVEADAGLLEDDLVHEVLENGATSLRRRHVGVDRDVLVVLRCGLVLCLDCGVDVFVLNALRWVQTLLHTFVLVILFWCV